MEESSPLEGSTVQSLALSAMAVLCVDRIAMILEFQFAAPALCMVLDFELFGLPAIGRLLEITLFPTTVLSWNWPLPSRVRRFLERMALTRLLLFSIPVLGTILSVLGRHGRSDASRCGH